LAVVWLAGLCSAAQGCVRALLPQDASQDLLELLPVGVGQPPEFLVVDWSADHSIRNPRPDLSRTLGVPNACNDQPGCHGDKSVEWSVQALEKWYGQRKRPHYGSVLAAGRAGAPQARDQLTEVARDRLYPGVVRATAIDLLANYPGPETSESLNQAPADEESLVPLSAVRTLNTMRHPGRAEMVAPLLYDPVEAVRVEAAASDDASAYEGPHHGGECSAQRQGQVRCTGGKVVTKKLAECCVLDIRDESFNPHGVNKEAATKIALDSLCKKLERIRLGVEHGKLQGKDKIQVRVAESSRKGTPHLG
jgi:hypothetical protein